MIKTERCKIRFHGPCHEERKEGNSRKKIKKTQLSTVYLVREKIGSFAYNKKAKEWRKY